MDGRLITEVRTAAVSAVATERLAQYDASVLAITGSGMQARSHLEALRLVRDFREGRVWNPRRAADVIAAGEIFAEVGEVVSGAKPGRRSAEEVTSNSSGSE